MYIEYVRNQLGVSSTGSVHKMSNDNLERIYACSRAPRFKPTWLVRASDMQVVPGSSVYGYYWALSYSWNQSGEVIHRGGEDYDRIDEGKHRITEYRKIPGHNMKDRHGYNHIITDTDFDPETASTKFVTFEGLIQQICKDFYIDYIWYDQMCISQSNHEEKMREIKQMHLIYSNALCTVALVPEFQLTIEDGKLDRANQEILPNTQWCKRMWTLEEAYASEDILFLGRDVHHWGNASYVWRSSGRPCSDSYRVWMACTVLWYARNRMSSKAHDRIFALANILPEIMNDITFSYDQPLYDLMLQFYSALAQKDKTILWFGAPPDSEPEDGATPARQEEARISRSQKKSGRVVKTITQSKVLPSWTGANGVHVIHFSLSSISFTGASNCTVTGNCMRLTSSFITALIKPATVVEKPYDFDDPDKYHDTCYPQTNLKCKTHVDIIKSSVRIYFTEDGLPVSDNAHTPHYQRNDSYSCDGSTHLMFVTVPDQWHGIYTNNGTYRFGLKATHILPLILDRKDKVAINTLLEPTYCGGFLSLTEECSECVILSEPAFRDYLNDFTGYPVIKKHKDYYRSIGVFLLKKKISIDTLFQPKQIFDII